MNIQMLPQAFFKNSLIGTLIVLTTLAMTLPPRGWAMLAPADLMSAAPSPSVSRAEDLKTIQTTLESKMVRQRLSEFKLTPEQVNQRMSQLSDAQIHQVAIQIRTMNPAGDGGEGLGILITLLVIGILVLLFVYLFKRT